MKKLKKVLCFVLPIAIVIALVIGLLPVAILGKSDDNNQSITKEESFFGNKYGNQIVKADVSTGAGEVDSTKKGGVLYLAEGAHYTMNGGTIQDKKKDYGGAFYVSKNAELIINGGTINLCQAKYGGAIYIESGGRCYINGGTIINNIAEVAPAIYMESGAELEIDFANTEIKNNMLLEDAPLMITSSKMQIIGNCLSKQNLYVLEFGSYPQTYVGNALNGELEKWYQTIDHDKYDKCYTSGDEHTGHQVCDYAPFGLLNGTSNTWYGYKYIDGNYYVRVISARPPYAGMNVGYEKYKDYSNVLKGSRGGNIATGLGASHISLAASWFKVEPIKWYVLNYNEWRQGSGDIELFSELILAGNIYFNYNGSGKLNVTDYKFNDAFWCNSYMREWLNESFYNEAFTSKEKEYINIAISTTNYQQYGDLICQDKVLLKSYDEIMNCRVLSDPNSRVAALSDYALANYAKCSLTNTTTYKTRYRIGGCGYYWLRSCARGAPSINYVDYDGNLHGMDYSEIADPRIFNSLNGSAVINYTIGVRPSVHIRGSKVLGKVNDQVSIK